MLVFLALLSALPYFVNCGAGIDWEYDGKHGPDHWYEDFPDCAGVMQSPIFINSSMATYDISLLQFGMKGFDERIHTNMTMLNNGHTVQVNLVDTSLRTHGGGLTGGYKPVQFHFHWGADNTKGSEHVLDGRHYPMEMHIVHYSERFPSISDAIDKPDGLMVLGFFFEIGRYNIHFEEVFSYLKQVAHKGDEVMIPPVIMERLVPIDLVHYFRYRGSLTTPPCYESVVWTVFRESIKISSEQMNRFRIKIKKNPVNQTDVSLVDDYRPIQDLNGRNVYSSYKVNPELVPAEPVRPIIVCGNSNTNNNGGANSAIGSQYSFFLMVVCLFVPFFR